MSASRSRSDAPQQAGFRHVFEVKPEDIDELGHASNLAYVRWIQDVAVAHSAALGLGIETYLSVGAIFVVRRHEIDYLRPVRAGDRIAASTWIQTAGAARCERATELTMADDAGVVVARGMTTWGFVAMQTGRPTRIPDDVRKRFLPDAPDGV